MNTYLITAIYNVVGKTSIMAHSLEGAIEEHKENHSSEIAPHKVLSETFQAEGFESYCLVSDNEQILTKADESYLKKNFDHFPQGFAPVRKKAGSRQEDKNSQQMFPPYERAVLSNGKIRELCHDEVDALIYKYHAALEVAEKQLAVLKACSVSWGVDDFMDTAKKEGYMLKRKKAQELLESMIRHHDGELGINWETIKCLILDNCKPTKKKKLEIEKREREYGRLRLKREAARNEQRMR